MRILVLGGDGYLGWPTAMHFATSGNEVTAVDNYLRRNIATETDSDPLNSTPNLHVKCEVFKEKTGGNIEVKIADCADYCALSEIVMEAAPDCIVHFAEQPSAPYSMRDYASANLTITNNLSTTFNVIWSIIRHAPNCHLIKLGTMGEYGTPNIDIEEGWLTVNHNGRTEKFLYPRQAGSLYHTTKVLDTDLLWFYVRTHGLKVTDLMQGPVYGISTPEADLDPKLMPHFHYDDIFGTVVNRFIVQAIAGVPLTVYGSGGQVRGYLNILDTLQCLELAASNEPDHGELRILNQFTEQFTVKEIAKKIQAVGNEMGLGVSIQNIDNPRQEMEQHYYNAKHSGLMDLGLDPHYFSDEVIAKMIKQLLPYEKYICKSKIMPRVSWNG